MPQARRMTKKMLWGEIEHEAREDLGVSGSTDSPSVSIRIEFYLSLILVLRLVGLKKSARTKYHP